MDWFNPLIAVSGIVALFQIILSVFFYQLLSKFCSFIVCIFTVNILVCLCAVITPCEVDVVQFKSCLQSSNVVFSSKHLKYIFKLINLIHPRRLNSGNLFISKCLSRKIEQLRQTKPFVYTFVWGVNNDRIRNCTYAQKNELTETMGSNWYQ